MKRSLRPFIHLCRDPGVSSTRSHSQASTPHTAVRSMGVQLNSRQFEEMTIKVPWGHLAGKWYGPKEVRPIVGLHGWQDNAGTFDTLAPLLPAHLSFLSLDMPGHGRSSWLPAGHYYHSMDYVGLMLRIMDDYKWSHISILAHSMSSINTFQFAALFPDKIDMFIGLDILKPLIRDEAQIIDAFTERLLKNQMHERRMTDQSEPPRYDWEQMVERMHEGTQKSVSLKACQYLLQRNTKPSQLEPHKYYFSRDNRLKSALFSVWSPQMVLAMARRIKCPHLFIKAKKAPYYERKEYFDEALAVLQEKDNFEFHVVDGTHHVHLNEPNKIADIINPFIEKHRPEET